MNVRITLSFLMFVALVTLAATVHADADADSKRWYKEGTKHYNLGEFDEAIKAYKEGYDAKPDPVFLFNIAQSYRLWKKPEQAIFFYKSFLRNAPEAPNHAEVERRIQELQQELDQSGNNASTAPAPREVGPPPPPTQSPTAPPPPLPTVNQPAVREADGSAIQATSTEPQKPEPIYKQLWFWGAIGAVAVGAIVIIAASSGGNTEPKSDFPAVKVF